MTLRFLLFFTFAALAALQAQAATDFALREAIECQTRGGVPNFFQKLRSGREVRVGYLGGSITAAPGWRVKSLKWLQSKYPKAKLTEINAAIGGTGSDLGVFRLQQDVLQHLPDLLFVEFAVNDGGAPPERIIQAMEGIVRQTLKADASTDICFVYTISEPVLADAKAGRYQRSATAMELVAEHYDIPTIHLGLEVARKVGDGSLVFKGTRSNQAQPSDKSPMIFSTDGVHPLVETGHELYLQAITRSFEKLTGLGTPEAHRVPNPLDAANWEDAKLVPITESMLRGQWEKLDSAKHPLAKRFNSKLPVMWSTSDPTASLSFKFRGRQAAMYDLVGPDCGQLAVRVDDRAAVTVRRIDGYCTYHRLSKFTVYTGADSKPHRAQLALLAEPPDKKAILFERNRPDLEKNPAKYEGINWYIGSIMLLGDLVE